MTGIDEFLINSARSVDQALDRLLPAEDLPPVRLHSAMRWSTFAGGKRFRPALVYASGRAFGVASERLDRIAAAVEMMHTFSLIHDDLPAMDDDDLRRGQPTCHRKFDEATAILAGDGLQSLAFKVILDDESLSDRVKLRLARGLADASGSPSGMVAGQQLDLDSEGTGATLDEIETIHSLKTGALIRYSSASAAVVAETDTAAISKFGDRLGLLFQITDDLLDVTRTSDELGKTAGKDEAVKKATYPSILGIDGTRRLAADVCREALDALDSIDGDTEMFRGLCTKLVNRRS